MGDSGRQGPKRLEPVALLEPLFELSRLRSILFVVNNAFDKVRGVEHGERIKVVVSPHRGWGPSRRKGRASFRQAWMTHSLCGCSGQEDIRISFPIMPDASP